MFDSLDQTIKHDDEAAHSRKERIAQVIVVLALSVLLFSALYVAVKMLE